MGRVLGSRLILDLSLSTVSKLLNKLPPALSFSTKNIRLQLHGDAELTIARLHPHHARLALEGLVFETEEKPDRVSDRICALGLKENSRGADIARGAGPIVQLHRQTELKAFSDPSLLKTASSPHSAAQDASDLS